MSFSSILNRVVIALSLAAFLTVNSVAHEVKVGPNGGPVTDLGALHLELIMKTEKIDLFVTDAKGDPVDVSNASANVIILAGTKKHVTKLAPVADSVLGNTFSVPDPGPYTVVVIVTIPGKKAYQGRFKVSALLALQTMQSRSSV